MVKQRFNVGDLVRLKNIEELRKNLKVKASTADIALLDDCGIVIQVIENNKSNYVVVHWQKLNTEYNHFPHSLEKINDVAVD